MDDTIKFTREDVKRHLSELGYSNIEDSKLDEFCNDLRRLIKYEEKQKNIGKKLERLEKMELQLSENKENEDSSSTSVPKKKKRIRKAEKQRRKEEKLRSMSESSVDVVSRTEDILDFGQSHTASTSKNESSSLYIDVNLPPSRNDSSKALPLAASLIDQPPAGFIRARSGPSIGRRPASSDPVALHQKYQGYWEKFSAPGEKRHDKLRWAIRGWMMGEEPL